MGLEEKAFVFCSFNNPNKIEPVFFDVWMRILHTVPHSFLWLRKMGKSGEKNLRHEAEKRGIAPSRLLFAKRVPSKAEYLSRLGTADLALDTRIYNGHATTVDALWAGVPVVTLQGTHFASRAASSILTAAGLPELITENLQDYQNLAVRLASNPAELGRIRAKLAQNRIHAPLFDTAAFVRNLEAACQEIWHLHMSGEKPRQMEVRKSAFFQKPAVNSAQIAGNGESAERDSGSFASEKNKKQNLALPEIREKMETAVRCHQQGQWQKAEELYRKILEICPDHPDALHLLGLTAHQTGRNEESLVLIQKAVKLCPENHLYLSNLGLVLKLQNRTDEAISCYEKALQIKADADIHYRLGNALRVKQQNKEAVSAYQKALELQPAHTDAANNLGNLHKEMGEYDLALAWYRKALERKPESAGIYNNIGGVHKLRGEPDLAEISYRKCLEISPDNAEAYNNLGVLYQDQARHEAAAECYRKALAVRPEYAKAHSNLGSIFLFQEKYEKAVLTYAQSIKLDPEECLSHIHMGLAYKGMKKEDEALVCFRKALERKPDDIRSNVHYTDQLQYLCLWADLEKRKQDLREKIEKALENGEEIAETPFGNLTRYPDPGLNLKIARHRAREISKSVSFCKEKFSFAHRSHFRKKIRVGYLSDDFWNHPVSHLIVSLFALHDREKFEVFCYSSGQDDGSFYRKRIEKGCDCFTDIRGRHFADSARLIHGHQIDILVDLMGHTKNSLLNVCALRPAPVQMTWLGFPGTTGADFMDYILTDRIVSPPNHAPFYSEKLIYLPCCYMMTDNQQEISDREWKKSEMGVGEDCFVFCSLNNSYKLEPVMFDLWMNLLKKIPNSVLWLRSMGESGIRNIRNEAYARGVARERIVFTDRVPSKADYLSRLKLADLALDTRIYNGHATTVDALWAGVPVITLQGTHFASRAASSILTAAGLPELIGTGMEEYESLALRLASHPDQLRSIRQKLWENRLKSPLFDTKGFVRNLEKVYERIGQGLAQ